MSIADRLQSPRFPRASKYDPVTQFANASSGSNSLQMAEWLSEAVEIRPDMRILDLGCGKASTSIFFAKEFGCQVYACDLWFAATENRKRIIEASLDDRIIPFHCDARSLPFAAEYFDLVTCIDSYYYFGADPLYLNYIANFIKVGGRIAVAGAGFTRDLDAVPEYLRGWWSQDIWSFQNAAALRKLWGRTGIVEVESADTLENGWKHWLNWHYALHPNGSAEISAIEADRGRTLGYVRAVGRRLPGVRLEEYCWPDTLRVMLSETMEKELAEANASLNAATGEKGAPKG